MNMGLFKRKSPTIEVYAGKLEAENKDLRELVEQQKILLSAPPKEMEFKVALKVIKAFWEGI